MIARKRKEKILGEPVDLRKLNTEPKGWKFTLPLETYYGEKDKSIIRV